MDRLIRAAGLAVAGVLAWGVGVVPAAWADGEIPRPPGAVDGRGYELVSQVDKNQYPVIDGLLSADGNRVLYNLFGGAPGTFTGARPKLLATRTATGWVSTSPMPPRTEMPADSYAAVATTPDLSQWIASAQDSLGQEVLSPDVSLLRVMDTGAQTLLHTFPVYFGANGVEVVASSDLAHVYATVPERIDPSHRIGTFDVYDFGSGTPELVSRMPGTGLAPRCGVPHDGLGIAFVERHGSSAMRWASDDGSHVFFMTRGDGAPACSAPYQLYLRDTAAGTTTLISGPPLGGDPDAGVDRFLQAAADGSWAYFRTATSLAAADDVDGDATDQDIYRWSEGSGLSCATCVVPGAQVEPGDNQAAISDDGSHVYFTSAARLADAPAAGTDASPNIYVLRGGAVHFVARTDSSGRTLSSQVLNGGDLTPDGAVLIFVSRRPELNTASADNGGRLQYYRYDDLDDSVTCVSCPPGGAPGTSDVSTVLATNASSVPPDLRVVTDDGSRVFFVTDQRLAVEDGNGTSDIYEWENGSAHLITDGVTRALSGATAPQLLTVSGDGRDVLFLDPTRLTAEAVDGAFKLYDAREGGGFPPAPPPPSPCDGDACRGVPAVPPALVDPSSANASDPGNHRAGGATRFAVRVPTRAQRRSLVRTGRGRIAVTLRAAGRVSLQGQALVGGRIRTVAHATKAAGRAGVVVLRIKLTKAARVQLAADGRLRLVLVVSCSNSTRFERIVLALKRKASR